MQLFSICWELTTGLLEEANYSLHLTENGTDAWSLQQPSQDHLALGRMLKFETMI